MKHATLTLAAFVLAPGLLIAAPLPPELSLVPSNAAGFVSIRVADVWNAARLKPLGDYLGKDSGEVQRFEKQNGFALDALERATFVIAGFDPQRGPSEPLVVLTFAKPYNLAALVDAWHGMSPA